MKIRPVGTELFYVDGQTDRQTDRQTDSGSNGRTELAKLVFTCRNFVKAPINNGGTGEPG